MSATCRSCNAPILWAETKSGKRIPLDAVPDLAGNILLESGHAKMLTRESIEGQQRLGTLLYRSHFATCPDAIKHRKTTRSNL